MNEMPRAKHLTRSAKTRASLANRPQREFQQHESPRLGEHTQIDTTKFDAEITLDNGSVTTRNGVERPEMTILLEIRSRTPMAAVLRAGGTKSVDLVTLLARALTPYERRPQGARETRELVSSAWADPHGISQEELDRYRSMVPVIFPENITVDHGKIFTSTAFTEACERLGISLIECNPYTPTGKPHVEANFGSVAEQFAQYLRSHVGRSVEHRGKDDAPHPPPTLLQAQELLDDWIAVHWMHRPHDGLRDPLRPSRALTPMETVTLLRQITPDLVIPFGREEYISLLPREDRTIRSLKSASTRSRSRSEYRSAARLSRSADPSMPMRRAAPVPATARPSAPRTRPVPTPSSTMTRGSSVVSASPRSAAASGDPMSSSP